MKKLLLLCLFTAGMFFCFSQSFGNEFRNLEILEKELSEAKTPEQKANALMGLYQYHNRHSEPYNKKAAIDYRRQMEIFVHETNDPELVARVLFITIPTGNSGTKADVLKGIQRLYDYAKLHKLDHFKARAKIRESSYYFTFQPDYNKAVQLLNEALNLSKDLNDSLRTGILIQVAGRYNSMNNQLQALKFGFQAHEIAAKTKSLLLLQICNSLFEETYRSLEDYNKAIEYTLKNIQLTKLANRPHLAAFMHSRIAGYYFRLDQPVLGDYHIKEAYRLADSIKGSKRLYNEITGFIIAALTFSDQNEVLAEFLKNYRQHFFIVPGSDFLDNVTLARAFAKINNMDSARVLIKRATENLSDNTSADLRKRYFYTLARIASYDQTWDAAVENFSKCLLITLSQNDLTESIQYTDSLKNILAKQHLFPQAFRYSLLQDSLQAELAKQLDKEDITRQEVAALEKQKELEAIEKEKEKQQRYNVQYLGITFGVVALFIILLLMGIFKVSPRTIKILSFFSFLLFFEFIFLIFKKQIAVVTHGEPWKDLAFMVLLAAVMVPLHHWGEHKVVEYLSTKKITFPKKNFFLRKTTAKKEVMN